MIFVAAIVTGALIESGGLIGARDRLPRAPGPTDQSPSMGATPVGPTPFREVPLTRGLVAITERVAALKWFAAVHKTHFYGVRRLGAGRLYLHRFILDCPPDLLVDHINGNGLDCRRSNMRLCNRRQNALNRRSILPTKGIEHDGNRYRARIRVNGTKIHLGSFATVEDATAAYDAAAIKYFGEFAWLNSGRDARNA